MYSHVCVAVSVYIHEGEIKRIKTTSSLLVSYKEDTGLSVCQLMCSESRFLHVLYCHLPDTDDYANI